MQGVVKLFLRSQHYGFISTEAGDFFFHGSGVIGGADTIRTGEHVQFWLDDDPRGRGNLIAVDVRPLRFE
jgi:cold shock CspA family protein